MQATASCADILSNYIDHSYAGTQNASGDDQLQLDIDCDNAVFSAVRESGVFSIAASEETPCETDVSNSVTEGALYALGFDPLDGSSIIDANFSVGSIFGIWPDNGNLKGRTGREQVASAVALYGPRTTMCIALAAKARNIEHEKPIVLEVTLIEGRSIWVLSRERVILKEEGKVFAPGNLRATNEDKRYAALLQHWIAERYTLRYSGGMVPDVYHMLAKSKGVFTNVSSSTSKAKLRLLYEVAPIALIIEAAGGLTTHEAYDGSVLDETIDDLDKRVGACFGSKLEVMKFKQFMFSN